MAAFCPYCERRCVLTPGGRGFCEMYTLSRKDGQVVEVFPHRYSSIQVNPIERLPFFHFYPGSRVLVLGGAGCNMDCDYCINSYVVRGDPEEVLQFSLPPRRIISLAQELGCQSIAFAINEPTVALPSLLELAEAAASQGLPVGIMTNGYATAEATARMGRTFAFISVSLKSLKDEFCQEFLGVESVRAVLRNLEILVSLTHVEVVTPVVQGLNDRELKDMAEFIFRLNPEIPWHIFRLQPEHRTARQRPPEIPPLAELVQEVRTRLPYTYLGNFPGSQWVSTLCPRCGKEVVSRLSLGGCGAQLVSLHLKGDSCAYCGFPLPFKIQE